MAPPNKPTINTNKKLINVKLTAIPESTPILANKEADTNSRLPNPPIEGTADAIQISGLKIKK